MSSKLPSLTVKPYTTGNDEYVVISRGHLSQFKVRHDEITKLANDLIDHLEQGN